MTKRKRASTSRLRAGTKAAEEGSETRRTSEGGGVEAACDQLRCEIRALEGERAKVSEQQRELEEQKRRLDEQLRPLRIKEEQIQRKLLPKRARLQEIENARLLDRLPHEVWEKILGEFEDADLFPLALTCRYFRQKQKELLARPRQRELELLESPHRALATNILRWPQKGQRASAEYLRFLRKEKVPRDVGRQKAKYVRWLAAYHGHLPLLQELMAALEKKDRRSIILTSRFFMKPSKDMQEIADSAGESPSSQPFLYLLLCFGF